MRLFFCAFIAIFLASCEKAPPVDQGNLPPAGSAHVLVGCEGSLGNGNAALTVYDPASRQATEDVFRAANQAPLGDVLESITDGGTSWLLSVNNSDKVCVIDKETFLLERAIAVPKPRYITVLSPTQAYVSTLFSNKIYRINPQDGTVSSVLDLPHNNPERMLLQDHRLYIACWDTTAGTVLCLDTNVDTLMPDKSLHIQGRAPQQILATRDGALWVLGGNPTYGYPCTWSRFNAEGQLLQTILFPAQADALRAALNPGRDTLYWIEAAYQAGNDRNGIYRMDMNSTQIPSQAFIPAGTFQYFWALGIDPESGLIYVGDPKGFVQRGTVHIFTPQGEEQNTFNTAIGPGSFFFKP